MRTCIFPAVKSSSTVCRSWLSRPGGKGERGVSKRGGGKGVNREQEGVGGGERVFVRWCVVKRVC